MFAVTGLTRLEDLRLTTAKSMMTTYLLVKNVEKSSTLREVFTSTKEKSTALTQDQEINIVVVFAVTSLTLREVFTSTTDKFTMTNFTVVRNATQSLKQGKNYIGIKRRNTNNLSLFSLLLVNNVYK
jgi:phosphoribosyl-dephospho-CoA transferase